jgi:hypothetical protein
VETPVPKTRTIAAAALFALALSVITVPSAAFAAGTGTLTVQLVTPSGAPDALAGIGITERYPHDGSYSDEADGTTDASGAVTFDGVPAGVKLQVILSPGTSALASETKTGIVVKSGHTLVYKLAADIGATVSGTLLRPGDSGLPGAVVALLDSHGQAQHYTVTGSSGAYSFTNLPSGTYRVQFNSRKLAPFDTAALTESWSYWKNTTSWSKAKSITVSQQSKKKHATNLTGINGTVQQGTTLSGSVTISGNYDLSEVRIDAKTTADSYLAEVNASGNGFSTLVNPGKYRIGIIGAVDPVVGVAPIYWYRSDSTGPTLDESKATWVTVGSGAKSITFANAERAF